MSAEEWVKEYIGNKFDSCGVINKHIWSSSPVPGTELQTPWNFLSDGRVL